MSDELNKHRIPYAFLNDMKDRFTFKFGNDEPQTAIAFSMNEEFSKIICERMAFYNSDAADMTLDNIGAVKSQIEDVKGIMVQNIEKVLERGEKIELLVDKTDRLNQQAFKFESSSRNLRRSLPSFSSTLLLHRSVGLTFIGATPRNSAIAKCFWFFD
jgi:vesicle-associated membrane protein 7